MADTPNLAPTTTRRRTSNGPSRSAGAAANRARQDQLEDQIAQLQTDLKGIAATLARLSGDKVSEVRDVAKGEMRHLQRRGQHVMEDVQDQASQLEKQLTDTIREKPLTAVASAVGIGFILALLTRH